MADEHGVILPPGVERPSATDSANVVIDNRTGLDDALVQAAVETYFVEHSSLNGQQVSTFFTYSNEGSMLARRQYRTPTGVIDEIKLARQLAERDDDIGATIGSMVATAFRDGYENYHRDDRTTQLFNGAAKFMGGSATLKALYRELLISGSVTAIAFPVRTQLSWLPADSETSRDEDVVGLKVTPWPAEQLRPIGNDLFGDAGLALVPENDEDLAEWLKEFFADDTTAARRAAMRREDPVAAALFIEKVKVDNDRDLLGSTSDAYRLNPRMAFRYGFPKLPGESHSRPLMTRDFALLEAKRLLNIMDYALLQGGSNYIVVAKKGTDERPALPEEVANLTDVVRRASRTGVLVGDHRLSFEIVTPNMDALLNEKRRRLIGRKLAAGLLRLPEQNTEAAGQAGMAAELELLSAVITSDRHDLVEQLVEAKLYDQLVQRNPGLFTQGPPDIWLPKIILQGSQFFTDFVLKLRDRGDIPRKFAVQAAGFDWDAGVAQRKRELESGVDETMAPAAVPFSSPNMGPQDNNEGRPVGSGPDNGAPGATQRDAPANVRPLRTINRNAGETVKAYLEPAEDGEGEHTVRAGVQTRSILEQYPDWELGRVTALERDTIASRKPFRTGPLAIIPVNPGYQVTELRAARLAEGLSMIVGERVGDRAIVAKALCFRQPEFDVLDAEETALRWGFPIDGWEELEEVARLEEPEPRELPAPVNVNQPLEVHVHVPGQQPFIRRVIRDEHGNAIGTEEVPVDPELTDEALTELAKGGVAKGKYVYLRCPNCGLVQDAAHDKCTRCKHDLTGARKAMFASLRQKGEKPTLHSKPPPPASKQPDIRKKS